MITFEARRIRQNAPEINVLCFERAKLNVCMNQRPTCTTSICVLQREPTRIWHAHRAARPSATCTCSTPWITADHTASIAAAFRHIIATSHRIRYVQVHAPVASTTIHALAQRHGKRTRSCVHLYIHRLPCNVQSNVVLAQLRQRAVKRGVLDPIWNTCVCDNGLRVVLVAVAAALVNGLLVTECGKRIPFAVQQALASLFHGEICTDERDVNGEWLELLSKFVRGRRRTQKTRTPDTN
mmetsp:Transcript_16242/g.35219  ORF Transcript_16242/g.35219 Transcript_16242/m.35219 type:complete len:239 (-) Transcript_16242:270-986(-)